MVEYGSTLYVGLMGMFQKLLQNSTGKFKPFFHFKMYKARENIGAIKQIVTAHPGFYLEIFLWGGGGGGGGS